MSEYRSNIKSNFSMRRLFIYLAGLNILDAFVTYFGFSHDLITEKNPLMYALLSKSTTYFLLVKLGVSLFFLFLSLLATNLEKVKFIRIIVNILLRLVVFLYTVVTIFHFKWVLTTIQKLY